MHTRTSAFDICVVGEKEKVGRKRGGRKEGGGGGGQGGKRKKKGGGRGERGGGGGKEGGGEGEERRGTRQGRVSKKEECLVLYTAHLKCVTAYSFKDSLGWLVFRIFGFVNFNQNFYIKYHETPNISTAVLQGTSTCNTENTSYVQ